VSLPIGIMENSSSQNPNGDSFDVGGGDTNYVSFQEMEHDDDGLGALPNSQQAIKTPFNSFKSDNDIYDSRHSTNESLDLGNTQVSAGVLGSRSNSLNSEHSFHAVSEPDFAESSSVHSNVDQP